MQWSSFFKIILTFGERSNVWYVVLAAYKRIMLTINIVREITCTVSGADKARIIRGVAANTAISIPIKCVIALPGSFILK